MKKKIYARELSRDQLILCFGVIVQHDWLIERYLLRNRVFYGGKTKSRCFDLFTHWLIKQIMNTYRNHFSRSNENRSISHHDVGNSRRVGVRVESWPENQALFAKSDIVNHQIGTSDHNRVGFWIKRGAATPALSVF